MAKIDKLIIADEMLDASIEEYLDKKRCSVALNLSGVAQEIYGKAIRIEKGTDTISKIANESFSIYKDNQDSEATLKEFKKISVHAKNGIKHFDDVGDRYLEFNPSKEARLMIAIALNDKIQLKRSLSPWDKRFKEFVAIYNWHNN